LIEKAPAVLPQADEDMAEFLHSPLARNGVNVILGDGLVKFDTKKDVKVALLEDTTNILIHPETRRYE
jgi:NADPH-dependent 2,4-dienoyl-CoA reductase/sulfur reductase-like enzyme